jgi:hypothetical protein
MYTMTTATSRGGKITRTGYSANRKTPSARMRIPISDQATNPQRPARATNVFEKNGARSVDTRDP